MATLTLAQHAQLTKEPLKKGIMLGLAMEGLIADRLSWRSTGGRLRETGVRFDEVTSPDWIPLDGTISSYTANGNPLSFGVHQMGMHIDIPVNLEKATGDQLERDSAIQTKLALKGAAYVLNDTFVNGDQSSDANQFEGINKLVGQLGSSQRVGATEIDLTATYTDALAESFFARLDEATYAAEGHDYDFALANSTTLLKMESFARQYKMMGDHFNWMDKAYQVGDPRSTQRTKSSRPAFHYRGKPWYDIGLKADQSTKIIGNTYAEGASAAATRIFLIKQGSDELEGLEFSPLDTIEIGRLEAKEVLRWRVLWTVGLALWGPRSVVKVQGIKVA